MIHQSTREDFIDFEIFRLESASDTLDLQCLQRTLANETRDTNITIGSTIGMLLGLLTSTALLLTFPICYRLQCLIPHTFAPTGLSLTDVGNDTGGALELSWNHSQDQFSTYEVYLTLHNLVIYPD